MRADELMTTPITTCQSNESLDTAARQLWEHDCGILAIVNDRGTLVGMLTDRDICMCAMMQHQTLSEISVGIAMSKAVYAVTADVPLEEVEALMAEQQLRRIPVVDAEQRPIGIVTINDLVREVVRVSPRIGDRRVMVALAAIGAHHKLVDQAA